MSLTRRALLSLPVAIPLLNLAARTAVGDDLTFLRLTLRAAGGGL